MGSNRPFRRLWAELRQDLIDYRMEVRRIAPDGGLGIWRDYPRWARDSRRSGSPLEEGKPWVTYAATSFLEGVLRPDTRVFEFGSGGSTVFFGSRVAEVVAAEHDPEWGERVRAELAKRGLAAARVLIREPEKSSEPVSGDPSDPSGYRSSDVAYSDHFFRAYAASIDEFPEEYFDLVMIDGRARPSCLLHAVPRLRPGGYVVLDNAERDVYQSIHQEMASRGWAKHDLAGPGAYSRYFWSTCAWRKPG